MTGEPLSGLKRRKSGDFTRAISAAGRLRKASDDAANDLQFMVNLAGRYERALIDIRQLTVDIGDSVEAATRACDVAMEALGE